MNPHKPPRGGCPPSVAGFCHGCAVGLPDAESGAGAFPAPTSNEEAADEDGVGVEEEEEEPLSSP